MVMGHSTGRGSGAWVSWLSAQGAQGGGWGLGSWVDPIRTSEAAAVGKQAVSGQFKDPQSRAVR